MLKGKRVNLDAKYNEHSSKMKVKVFFRLKISWMEKSHQQTKSKGSSSGGRKWKEKTWIYIKKWTADRYNMDKNTLSKINQTKKSEYYIISLI